MKTPEWVKDSLAYLHTITPYTRRKKFIKQYYKNGFSDADIWGLDTHLAELIAPRLKRFRKLVQSHPPDLTMEQWQEVLDKMIKAFEYLSEFQLKRDEDKERQAQEGLELFAKWFGYLWD